jgi:hypothetical protein
MIGGEVRTSSEIINGQLSIINARVPHGSARMDLGRVHLCVGLLHRQFSQRGDLSPAA